jgi:acyl-CoA reductase-like NAD-dependent aldehyde dehydrogenase
MIGRHFIGGTWVGDPAQTTLNPSDLSEIVGTYAEGDALVVDLAVKAAQAAQPHWARTTPWQRHQILEAASRELLARTDELGKLLAQEEGKTLPEAKGEVMRAGQIFAFYAGEALRLQGERGASVRPGVDVEVDRSPLGVVGLITPWNFPIAIPAWKAAPALAYGNAVVMKPSEVAPGCAVALAEILQRAGLPDGVFNLVLGSGGQLGATLAAHPGLNGLSFTGSQATGKAIAAQGAGRLLRLQLEMGGKNPLIVLDDASLEVAVECAVQGAFFSTGQRCTASSRLIVTGGIHDRFVHALVERMKGLRVGHALEPATHIGPVVNEAQWAKNLRWLERGKADGGRLICGGEHLERGTRGWFQAPALFVDTHNDMPLNQEEVFGPIASVICAKHADEALELANATPFGLSAGICTTSLRHASEFKRRIQAGMRMVNLPTAGVDFHVPFGGMKGSSFGPREQGGSAKDFYTVLTTTYQAP